LPFTPALAALPCFAPLYTHLLEADFVLSQLLPLVAARKASSMLTESLDAQLPLS